MHALYLLWPAWVPKRRSAPLPEPPPLEAKRRGSAALFDLGEEWLPVCRRAREIPDPPSLTPIRRRLGFLFEGFTAPYENNLRVRRDPVPFAPPWHPEQRSPKLGGLIQAIAEDLERQKQKRYVPLDPKVKPRDSEHQQISRAILNGLIRGGELVQEGEDIYSWGYTPSNRSDWDPPAPTTVGEAIDRLAVLFKTLQGIGGNGA